MSDLGASLSLALELSALGQSIKHSYWIYPSLEILHSLGIALLVGPVILMDLRILGVASGHVSLQSLSWLATRVGLFGLGIAAIAGLLMFTAQATSLLGSTLFQLKLLLILGLLLNALLVRRSCQRAFEAQHQGWAKRPGKLTASLRLQALTSIVGWIVVIGMGRWMAYV